MANLDKKPEPKAKAINKPTEARLKGAAYERNHYLLRVEPGTTIENLLTPEFWSHLGQKLRPTDIVEVIPDDGSYFAILFVVANDRLWAKMHVLGYHDLTEAAKDMPVTDSQNHSVEWKGGTMKFAVIRLSDGAILKSEFQTKLEGWQWLDNHLKSLAA